MLISFLSFSLYPSLAQYRIILEVYVLYGLRMLYERVHAVGHCYTGLSCKLFIEFGVIIRARKFTKFTEFVILVLIVNFWRNNYMEIKVLGAMTFSILKYVTLKNLHVFYR